ncbi:MAG: HAD family hydrolase [Candidatus Odinarchaeota archaeon]
MDFDRDKIKAIFFDLDGTLCYLNGAFGELFKNVCSPVLEENPSISLEEVLDSFSKALAIEGHSTAELALQRAFLSLDVRKPYDYENLGREFNSQHAKQVRLFDGAENILLELHKIYKLVLITNGPQDTQQEVVDTLGLGDKFDLIVISGDEKVGIRKPDTRIFQLALDVLGIPASDTVMIGNNPETDLSGASALGMKTILVKNEPGIEYEESITRIAKLFLKE